MRLQACVFLIRLVVWLIYKLLTFCRTWCAPVMQAWVKGNLYSKIAVVSNRWRRNLLLLVLVCLLIFYMWPFANTRRRVDAVQICLDSALQAHKVALKHNDAVLSDSEHSEFLPFVGNGYIGVDMEGDTQLYIKDGRSLALSLPFNPVVQISVVGYNNKESRLIDFKSGLVKRITCYGIGSSTVRAETTAYAHRTRSSVFIQDIRITNPSVTPVTLNIKQTGVSGGIDVKHETRSGLMSQASSVEFTMTTGLVYIQNAPVQQKQLFAIASSKLPDTVTVRPSETWRFQVVIVVKMTDKRVTKLVTKELVQSTERELLEVLNTGSQKLLMEHISVWRELWRSGFGISESKAAGILNGDRINSTIYYLMSQTASYLNMKDMTVAQQAALRQDLYTVDRCYSGHHTLQNTKMWEVPSNSLALSTLANTWLITLEKYGCANMLRAGADGVLQAMLLSFGQLQFGDRHLEFKTHPKDLHRDYYFRRINYGNNTHVNISVVVGDDNKAVIYVALDRNDMPFYACDAGCQDPPIKLGKEMTQLPVKLTDPLTAILYITADRTHMLEMKEALHLRQVAEGEYDVSPSVLSLTAPAHEQHVISLHKHGHHFGGLPMLFWASIGLLIAVFHLFLFKLIFNEYCQSSEPSYIRPKYNM